MGCYSLGWPMIKNKLRNYIEDAVEELSKNNNLSLVESMDVLSHMVVTKNKNPIFGDFASNIALLLAKVAKKSAYDMAFMLKDILVANEHISKVEVAKSGLLNLSVNDQLLSMVIPYIAHKNDDYGRLSPNHLKVLLEFVSANPTGGLHLGHARCAFMGDALARLLHAAGYEVVREFYVNDMGNQVETLSRTIYKRYCELLGQSISIAQDEYPGDYVKDIASALLKRDGDIWLDKTMDEWLYPLACFGVEFNLNLIKASLKRADIYMDAYYFESKLHHNGSLDALLAKLKERNMLYEADIALGNEDKVRRDESKAAIYAHLQEGGLFIKTKQWGDDEDRIIQRKDGRFVYLTADLAYHDDKYQRGFDKLIDIFGADHAGHIGRIKAGMKALGNDVNKLSFILVQIMRLIKDGVELRFSKRSGNVIGLDDLIDEVGPDVARFVFLMRGAHTQFDLDLDEVLTSSPDNPVFYIQYGHARMATILDKAKIEFNITPDLKSFSLAQQQLLSLPLERDLILKASELEEVVLDAAHNLEPHRLIFYAQELIKLFHAYFTKYRQSEKIISDDKEKTLARLNLIAAIKQTIYNALKILGISAPNHMALKEQT